MGFLASSSVFEELARKYTQTHDKEITPLAKRWLASLIFLRLVVRSDKRDLLFPAYRNCIWHLFAFVDGIFVQKESE